MRCSTPPSKMRKFARPRPVIDVPSGANTLQLTGTRFTRTRKARAAPFSFASFGVGPGSTMWSSPEFASRLNVTFASSCIGRGDFDLCCGACAITKSGAATPRQNKDAMAISFCRAVNAREFVGVRAGTARVSVEVKVAQRSFHRLVFRLLEPFSEFPGEHIFFVFLSFN